MLKRKRTTIEQIEFEVETKQKHIEEGECRLSNRCMEKLAISESLMTLFPDETNHHVRLNAGHIWFNADGWRWIANTPRIASRSLIQFDNPRTKHLVKPHRYRVTAQRTTKIIPNPRKRQNQINAARQKRIAAGIPDKKYTEQSLRKRIIGFR